MSEYHHRSSRFLMEILMKCSKLYLVMLVTVLVALPLSAQTIKRQLGQDDQASETSKPDRKVKALPVVEGDSDESAQDRITVQKLKQKMDAGEDIVILDVRSDLAYHGSTVKI